MRPANTPSSRCEIAQAFAFRVEHFRREGEAARQHPIFDDSGPDSDRAVAGSHRAAVVAYDAQVQRPLAQRSAMGRDLDGERNEECDARDHGDEEDAQGRIGHRAPRPCGQREEQKCASHVHGRIEDGSGEALHGGGRRDVEAHRLAGADVIVLKGVRLTALRAHM